ncbi:FHA domain-containing protein, partial [Salmonella enterica]
MAEEKARQQTLSLHVVNGNELEIGRTARCLFTRDG